jgi:DNA-binding LacI/PurR family transcriptional regulator
MHKKMKQIDRESPISLQHQLYEVLKEWFMTEPFPSGFLPSEAEIAKKFGLSRGTVRIALDRLVSEGIIIRNAGRGSMLRPDYLIKLRKYRIGVILSKVDFFTDAIWEYSWPSHLEIINGIMQSNLLYNLSTELISEEFFDEACNKEYDGFILWPYVHASLENRCMKPYVKMIYTIDLISGFEKIAADIVRKGFKTIGYIGFDSRGRIEAMNAVFEKANHAPIQSQAIIECGGSAEEAYRTCVELFDRNFQFDCIVCSTDIRAHGVLQFLSERGIAVPDEVAVYGFDGPRRQKGGITLTTCRFDWTYPGRFAVESIRKKLDGVELGVYALPVGELIEGQSTAVGTMPNVDYRL